MTNHQNKCFITLIIKALEIKKKFKLYTSEKEYAKAENENAEINKCLCTKFSESFNSVLNAPKNEKSTGFFNKFLVEDSVENFILKSVFGFLGGILLTYICFMFLVFSLNFTLKRATYICMGLGVILSLGLAFSVKIRCTVFLCIPQLFSKRGRQALLAYAFILALSGPAKNTLHNVEVMSESLACTQEQLKQAENELLKCVQKPNAAAKKSIEKLLEKINFAVKDFKNFILQLYKNCFDILETVLHAQKWLYSITLLCHKRMGKPAHRCLNLLAETREICEESLFPFGPWKKLCRIDPKSQEMICSANAKSVCMRSDVPASLPVLNLQKQLDTFKHRAMNIFYVSIEAHQTYSQTNRSYTYHEEYQGMATEIRQKTDQFLQYFDFMSVIFGIFILVLFVKVIIYRHKFLTEDHYDNRYITADFVDIDNTRAAFRMETLLPLAPRERMQYIKVSSVRLVPCERVRLLSSFVFLIFATFKIIIHMLTDSSLYWILSSVRRDERLLYMSTLKEEEPIITVRVVGDGLVAALFRNVTKAVKRESSLTRLDPTPCLPDPVPPDWNRYYQIIALVIICWLLALCEPYGLRLRHTVMVTYHPDRARERAIWLYNRIISNRISFVKISRRELRKKYKDVTLEDTFKYKFMRRATPLKCLLCKTTINSVNSCVKCTTVKCVGFYCSSCFASLKFCSICSNPAEYGDLSDISEEKDSSEEEGLCKSPTNKGQSPKVVRCKEKKKDGFSLNIKKANIKLKQGTKDHKAKTSDSDSCVQSTFLLRVLKYCRSKVPAFRQLRSFSDVESSDWDHESALITENDSAEIKQSLSKETNKTDKIERESKSERKKSKGSIKNTAGRKKSKEKKDCDKLKKPEKSPKQMPKVCLFKKLSFPTFHASIESDTTSGNLLDAEEKPKPDFHFKTYKMDDRDSTCDFNPTAFHKVRGSIEIFRLKQQERSNKSISKSSKKRDSDTFFDEEEEKELNETELCGGSSAEDPKSQIIAAPLILNRKYSKSKNSSPQTFPFIDPINVHKFASGEDSENEAHFKKEASDLYSDEDSTDVVILKEEDVDKSRSFITQTATPSLPYTASRTRVCFRNTDSSDSVVGSARLCLKEGSVNSSSESDCQYYSEPYRPPDLCLQPSKTSSDIKRTFGKLNLGNTTSKFNDFYSVETDSSNDKFLSVKSSRRVRKKPKKAKQGEEPGVFVKLLANSSSQAKQSKRADFLKAKVVQFFKKNLRERKSSLEEGSSDIDDVEYMPNTTIFLSDEEFQKLSKQISNKETKNEDSKHLPWVPYFLTDLPSPK